MNHQLSFRGDVKPSVPGPASLSAREINHDTFRKEPGDCLPMFVASSCLFGLSTSYSTHTHVSPMWLGTASVNTYRVAAENRTDIDIDVCFVYIFIS